MNLEPFRDVRVLLCDADDCLFPSEEPAFCASTAVTNELLADLGVDRRFTARELQALAAGKNFRTTAIELALTFDVPLEEALAAAHPGALVGRRGERPVLTAQELERRLVVERDAVSAHLSRSLTPDRTVIEALAQLGRRFGLAVVSSSALARLDACFEATGLAALFPPDVRFSAEDSLSAPTSKPDPAVYEFARIQLGLSPREGLAIEDSVSGVRSALAAGLPTIANVHFVPPAQRPGRVAALREAGVTAVVSSWGELVALFGLTGP